MAQLPSNEEVAAVLRRLRKIAAILRLREPSSALEFDKIVTQPPPQDEYLTDRQLFAREFHEFVRTRCPELPQAIRERDSAQTYPERHAWFINRCAELTDWVLREWNAWLATLGDEQWPELAEWWNDYSNAVALQASDWDSMMPTGRNGWPDVAQAAWSFPGEYLVGFGGFDARFAGPVVNWLVGGPHTFFNLDQAAVQNLQQRVIFDCLRQVPPDALRIHLFDPELLGRALSPFAPLQDMFPFLFGDRVWTGDLRSLAETLKTEIARRQREVGASGVADAGALNRSLGRMAVPIDLVLLTGLERCRHEELALLAPILQLGPAVSVIPILTLGIGGNEGLAWCRHRFGDAVQNLVDAYWSGRVMTRSADRGEGPSWVPRGIAGPLAAGRGDALIAAAAEYAKTIPDRTAVKLDSVVTTAARQSIDGVLVPIGTSGNAAVEVRFGDDPVHGLIVGDAGSGKSNLLHVFITSAIAAYDASELELFLVDMKEGVEFTSVYATGDDHALFENIRIVAADADPEFGVGVLDRAVEEIRLRGERFRDTGIRSFAEYRNAGHPMARLVIVIDEFQNLFRGSDAVRDRAWATITQIAREGRAFGVHLLLATQTFQGVAGGNLSGARGAYEQFGLRIALRCSVDDSTFMLDETSAATISNRGEAIVSTRRGTDDNKRIQIARYEGVIPGLHHGAFPAQVFNGRARAFDPTYFPPTETRRYSSLPLGTSTDLGPHPTADLWREGHRNIGVMWGGPRNAPALVGLMDALAVSASRIGRRLLIVDSVSPASPIRDLLDELWGRVEKLGGVELTDDPTRIGSAEGEVAGLGIALGLERAGQTDRIGDNLAERVAADAAAGSNWVVVAQNWRGFEEIFGRSMDRVLGVRIALHGLGDDGQRFLGSRYSEFKSGRAWIADAEMAGAVRSFIPFTGVA